jgi:hypothetical protein
MTQRLHDVERVGSVLAEVSSVRVLENVRGSAVLVDSCQFGALTKQVVNLTA